MTSEATYAEAGVPIHQLGLKWTTWTRGKIRMILDHYSVDYVTGASKLELLRELDILVRQRDLSVQDRREILADRATRTLIATAVQTSSVLQAPANFLPPLADFVHPEARDDSTTSADDNNIEDMDVKPNTVSVNDSEANERDSDSEMGVDNDKSCEVCFERLTLEAFPTRKTTAACSHEADVCFRCLAHFITSQNWDKMWNHIDCPSCSARLGYEDVRAFATAATFER